MWCNHAGPCFRPRCRNRLSRGHRPVWCLHLTHFGRGARTSFVAVIAVVLIPRPKRETSDNELDAHCLEHVDEKPQTSPGGRAQGQRSVVLAHTLCGHGRRLALLPSESNQHTVAVSSVGKGLALDRPQARATSDGLDGVFPCKPHRHLCHVPKSGLFDVSRQECSHQGLIAGGGWCCNRRQRARGRGLTPDL